MIGLALSAVLVPASIFMSRYTGMLDHPGDPLKIHAQAVPTLGGIAVILAAWTGSALVGDVPAGGESAALGILVGAGLIDGVRPLPPLLRLAAQVAAGSVLAATGSQLTPLGPLAGLGTVVLLVACANAANMLDGQDGLAGGQVALAAAGIAAVLAGSASSQDALLASTIGALCAFLLWNRPPARTFLGNSGPDALAVILVAGVAAGAQTHGGRGLLGGVSCLGVFLFEIVFTVLRRCGQGALTSGDRLHSYDLLAAKGNRRGHVTLWFWVGGALVSALGLAERAAPLSVGIPLFCAVVALMSLGGWQLWSRRPRAVEPARSSASERADSPRTRELRASAARPGRPRLPL